MAKQNKVLFIKKIWWSITKISKYDEMAKEGLKSAVKCLARLILFSAITLGIIGSYLQGIKFQKVYKYLSDNLPEFKLEKIEEKERSQIIQKYELSLNNNEVIILDNKEFVESVKSVVVINTNLDEKEAIKEYYELSKDKIDCMIFLKDECLIVSDDYNANNENQKDGIIRYSYIDLMNNYTNSVNTEKMELSKKDILGYLNMSLSYYLIIFSIYFLIALLIIFSFIATFMSITFFIANKWLKIDIKKKDVFSISIYSLILPEILYTIYLVTTYFSNLNISYILILDILIAYIYFAKYFYDMKKTCI